MNENNAAAGRAPRTAEDYLDVVRRVSIIGALALWKPRFVAEAFEASGEPCLRIELQLAVPGTDTEAIELCFRQEMRVARLNASAIPFEYRLVDMVRDVAVHEAFEGLCLDGKQIVNPHTRSLLPRKSIPWTSKQQGAP